MRSRERKFVWGLSFLLLISWTVVQGTTSNDKGRNVHEEVDESQDVQLKNKNSSPTNSSSAAEIWWKNAHKADKRALAGSTRSAESSAKPQSGISGSDDYSDYDQSPYGVTAGTSTRVTTTNRKALATPLAYPSEDDEEDNEDLSGYSETTLSSRQISNTAQPPSSSEEGNDEEEDSGYSVSHSTSQPKAVVALTSATKKRVKSSKKRVTIPSEDDDLVTLVSSDIEGRGDSTLKSVTAIFGVQEATPRTVHFVSSGSSSSSGAASPNFSSGRDISNFSNRRNTTLFEFSSGGRGNISASIPGLPELMPPPPTMQPLKPFTGSLKGPQPLSPASSVNSINIGSSFNRSQISNSAGSDDSDSQEQGGSSAPYQDDSSGPSPNYSQGDRSDGDELTPYQGGQSNSDDSYSGGESYGGSEGRSLGGGYGGNGWGSSMTINVPPPPIPPLPPRPMMIQIPPPPMPPSPPNINMNFPQPPPFPSSPPMPDMPRIQYPPFPQMPSFNMGWGGGGGNGRGWAR